MAEVKIVLDESQFGAVVLNKTLPVCDFYRQKDDELEFVTQRNADPNNPVLIAVTKQQYASWKNHKWVCQVIRDSNVT